MDKIVKDKIRLFNETGKQLWESPNGFIKKELVQVERLTCSHPKVKRMWETGSLAHLPTNSEMHYNLHLIFTDDTRKDFHGTNLDEVRNEVNVYLESISE